MYLPPSLGTTRVDKPAKAKAVVVYLASSKADFIQGLIINIGAGVAKSLHDIVIKGIFLSFAPNLL